jgi:hypothetical protein
MTMLEDFWLPRREGGRGTEITTLPGGQNLGEMDDVEYFRKKLYKSLNVPITRMEAENQFNLGRATEISRDEVKFAKFVSRLRLRFAGLFNELLRVQLSLRGIVNTQEWNSIKHNINYHFLKDNYFDELKFTEVLENRMRIAGEADQFVGTYFSKDWVRKNILMQTEDEAAEIDKEIAAGQPGEEEPVGQDGQGEQQPQQVANSQESTRHASISSMLKAVK